jgi:glc operon protein GlcG
MRRSLVLFSFTALCFGAALTQARADDVVYVSKEKVFASEAKPGTLASGSDHNVSMSRRDQGGQSEVHDTETDVFYVMEGSATFITGGTMVDAKTTAPGQIRGTGITGGTTHMLTKGDVIVVPKGTPHWFKEVPEVVVYFVVKAKS